MNTSKVAHKIIGDVLWELGDRSGFDDWWGGIDDEIQNEIESELVDIVKSILDAEQESKNEQ